IAQSISWAYAPGEGLARENEPLDASMSGVLALETIVAEAPEAVVLRYGLFYGPGTFYAPGGRTAERVMRGEMDATDGIRSFIHVEDAARAALLALDWPVGPVNIGDDEPAPGTEWL